jgi:ribosomal-protein-alanine N-acetyltransferase
MLVCNFNPFPVLHTTRLVLRRSDEQDAEAMYFLRSDPQVLKYIDREPEQSVATTIDFLKKVDDNIVNNEAISWAITLKGDDRLVGCISLWRIVKEHYRAEIGYVLHPGHQQKGIMHEAIQAVLNYGFSELKLHSVEANINPVNEASRRLLEKNNFVKEAHFKENYYFNGSFSDSAVYSLINPIK